MADLLSTLALERNVDEKLAKDILRIEKEHVYQKKRRTRGPISAEIEAYIKEVRQNDNK